MGMFKNTLLLAQQGDEKAMEKLLNRYDPLLKKCSIIQGHFDEDLYQSLILEFVRAVWKTKDGSYENTQYAQFDTFFEGIFEKQRFLDIIKNFICFSNEGTKQFKILAGYHQFAADSRS